MNIVIPMAGNGDRFVNEGFTDPKPLIMVRGKMVIEYVVDMFDRENDNFIFICNSRHLSGDYHMEEILRSLVSYCTIKSIAPHKLGPVFTVIQAEDLLTDEPMIVSYCDTAVTWSYWEFKKFVEGIDGCIVSHTGFHPHTLGTTMMAYSKTDGNKVLEIKEKECYTDNKYNEHASSGIYYFGSGSYIKYFHQLMDENISYNGEFYVTLIYNLMIKDNLSVYSYLNEITLSFGNPVDIRNYEAWQEIIDGGQVKDSMDAVRCYSYWNYYRSVNCVT